MDANAFYIRGKEYLEKENYSQAIADFWKAMELIHGPDNVEAFRETTEEKEFDPDVVAVFLNETLHQLIG